MLFEQMERPLPVLITLLKLFDKSWLFLLKQILQINSIISGTRDLKFAGAGPWLRGGGVDGSGGFVAVLRIKPMNTMLMSTIRFQIAPSRQCFVEHLRRLAESSSGTATTFVNSMLVRRKMRSFGRLNLLLRCYI